MSRRDAHHQAVVTALENDRWIITDDPLTLEFAGKLIGIDLAAEKLLAAEREGRQIAVEIKSFQGSSDVSEFHTAVGQFLNCRHVLARSLPDHTLYLAVPEQTFAGFSRTRRAGNRRNTRDQATGLRTISRGDCPMDRITTYQSTLRELVQEYAADWRPRDGTCIEAVTDTDNGHYQVIRTGWKEGRFVHSCLVHFAIRGGKVHLLKNDTEVEWERELAKRGVTPEDFVLAFRQPVDQAKAAATT